MRKIWLYILVAVTISTGCSKTNNLVKDIYFLGNGQRIYGLNLIDKEPQLIVNQHSWDLSVSPNGKYIAYLSPDSSGYCYQIYVKNLYSADDSKRITSLSINEVPGVTDGYYDPPYSWSPDSRYIIYCTGKKVVCHDIKLNHDTYWPRIGDFGYIEELAWAPKNDYIIIKSTLNMFAYSIKKERWQNLTNRISGDVPSLCWQKNGDYLLYCQDSTTYTIDIGNTKESIVYNKRIMEAQFYGFNNILFIEYGEGYQSNLFSLDLKTKNVKQLTNSKDKELVTQYTILGDSIIIYGIMNKTGGALMCLNLKNMRTSVLNDCIIQGHCFPVARIK